jgi:tetratricopeptide (TPR) repeat protein
VYDRRSTSQVADDDLRSGVDDPVCPSCVRGESRERAFPVLIAAGLLTLGPSLSAALTEGARLAAIYDAVLAAHFERARSDLRSACPPAPDPACRALAGASWWWQIQLDPDDRSLDDQFKQAAAEAVSASQGWTTREPQRGEAWFYLAGSYAPLVQWRAYRGERLAAARDANRIRAALERAIALDPSLPDAYFGIGLYHYYAEVAPLGAKILRFLMLLPGGSREQGLREMLQARDHGVLLRGEADYQLHWVYLWYERKPERARELLRGLDRRFPTNPLFLQRIAEVERDYFHDHRASAAAWQALLDRAVSGQVEFRSLAEARARIGLGTELIDLAQIDRAIDELTRAVALHPAHPYGAEAEAELALGAAYAQKGARDRARAALARAIATAPRDDPSHIRDRARAALARLRGFRRVAIFFDKNTAFVLDIHLFSSIIYIWYEGGKLRPSLVRVHACRATALPPR